MTFANATFDMNVHEIQMVADHLTASECHKLIGVLFKSRPSLKTKSAPKSERDLQSKACLDLLVSWNKSDREKSSFLDVAFGLEALGRKDLAETLSEAVYHEKAENIQQKFLNDPFRRMLIDYDSRPNRVIDNPSNNDNGDYSQRFLQGDTNVGTITSATIFFVVSISVLVTICLAFYRKQFNTCFPCRYVFASIDRTKEWCYMQVFGYTRYKSVISDTNQV